MTWITLLRIHVVYGHQSPRAASGAYRSAHSRRIPYLVPYATEWVDELDGAQ